MFLREYNTDIYSVRSWQINWNVVKYTIYSVLDFKLKLKCHIFIDILCSFSSCLHSFSISRNSANIFFRLLNPLLTLNFQITSNAADNLISEIGAMIQIYAWNCE
jgi:hypothetical protein